MDSLSPETRREIESQLDNTAKRTGAVASTLLGYTKHALWIVPVLIGIAFVVDYAVLRMSANPTGSVMVKRYYAVGLKNGKTEMYYADPENQMCVNSIFPHLGYAPCWYLRRYNVKQISI
jgi:hypothetical protein